MVSKNYRLYGLTQAQINAMHKAQGGLCKICGRPDTTKRNCLHIDHCHTTGAVRGLLCHHCNLMLGNARDSDEVLIKAALYLRLSREGT